MEFVDLPADGRSRYPALLENIRLATTEDNEELWVKLSQFPSVDSARDTANRLKGTHPLFEFTSRIDPNGVSGAVFTRYIGELE